MAVALCANCAAEKLGAFVKCSNCGFAPVTAMDWAWVLATTDRNANTVTRQRIAEEVISGNDTEAKVVVSSQTTLILGELLTNPSRRDPLLLARNIDEKNSEQINGHVISGGAYSGMVLKCGIDVSLADCETARSDGRNDIFVSVDYNGLMSIVNKRKWYLLFDRSTITRRKYGKTARYVKKLDAIYLMIVNEIVATDTWDIRAVCRNLGLT